MSDAGELTVDEPVAPSDNASPRAIPKTAPTSTNAHCRSRMVAASSANTPDSAELLSAATKPIPADSAETATIPNQSRRIPPSTSRT
jgi:hypothetical protein